jgi:hypothetical protein
VAAPRCRNCGGLDWTYALEDFDEHGRCVACREFPTLGYDVAALIEAVCAIPDGEQMGEPFILTDEQLRCQLHHYRLDPFTGRFPYFRGTQITRPQKWGKGPFSAAFICGEAHPDAPVLFDGWNADGQPVAADIPDTGLTRINLPSGGLIEPVTAAALSRLGQRVTFVVQDQTESWYKANGGHKLADNQRRGLAGMKGRFLSTPNAWDPREDSVAQRTAESTAPGVYHDDVEPGPGSVRNKADRRRMLKKVYGDAATKPRPDAPWEPWIDLERIDGEIVALLEHDPPQAERFFLNRKQAGEDAAFDHDAWTALTAPREIDPGRLIVIGADGARFNDALALVATHVPSGYQWPLGIWERPANADDSYEHPFDDIDGAMIEAFATWDVWRAYVDPQYIDHLLDAWQGRWGDKRVIAWHTTRPRQIASARAMADGRDPDLTHDGDPVMSQHVKNARKHTQNVKDDKGKAMYTLAKDRPDSPRKIDASMAGTLSWEALGDARAAGVTESMEPLVAWR